MFYCFYIFKAWDGKAMGKILSEGPYYTAGKLLIVKKWQPRTIEKMCTFTKILVWLKLYDAPIGILWDERLSYIGSIIVDPLYQE